MTHVRVILWEDVSVWWLDWNHNRLRDVEATPPWNHFSFTGHVKEMRWMTCIQKISLEWCSTLFWRCVSENGEPKKRRLSNDFICGIAPLQHVSKMWAKEFEHILVLYSILNKCKAIKADGLRFKWKMSSWKKQLSSCRTSFHYDPLTGRGDMETMWNVCQNKHLLVTIHWWNCTAQQIQNNCIPQIIFIPRWTLMRDMRWQQWSHLSKHYDRYQGIFQIMSSLPVSNYT